MAVSEVRISLQAFYRDGRPVVADEFITPLALRASDQVEAHPSLGRWNAALVSFPGLRLSDFSTQDEPSLAFHDGERQSFEVVASFLRARPTEVFDQMRSRGLSIQLYVGIRMDQDQMELSLPPPLLAACGERGIAVYIVSNDD